jgi:hypothetical protein
MHQNSSTATNVVGAEGSDVQRICPYKKKQKLKNDFFNIHGSVHRSMTQDK